MVVRPNQSHPQRSRLVPPHTFPSKLIEEEKEEEEEEEEEGKEGMKRKI